MRDRPGFGAIAESMGGIRFVTGYPDRPPVRIGISIGDSIAALHGAMGALMALRHRDATGGRGKGEGQLVDVALYEAVFNLMESTLPEYDVFGAVRTRTGGSLPGIVPSNTYECADGAAIVVAGNGDAIFRRLMTAIGRDDLANDPALARNEGRAKRVDEIDGAIQAWCRQRPIDAALAHLTAADVPVSRIYSVADMAGDPQFQARRMFEQAVLPDGTPMKVPAIVPKLSATPGETRWIGPRLGEHTDDVLRGLGYDDAAISALREEGVI
jgi:crotonobetainyl-CoA:carnitine CoA-transferase CaiB-like acyl-CoA transferase